MKTYFTEKVKKDKRIAYFSMEIGIDSRIPTYSGGLGVLAGDTLGTKRTMLAKEQPVESTYTNSLNLTAIR